jgi:hypothetical protein
VGVTTPNLLFVDWSQAKGGNMRRRALCIPRRPFVTYRIANE